VVRDGVARGSAVPIIGNGDILTHYEARRRLDESGVHAIMVGRGALTKPWIFQEHHDSAAWEPTAAERVAVYRRLVAYMKEHFGDDERGRRKSWYFLPWHFDFLSRYRPLPEELYGEASRERPLLQTRTNLPEEATPLERVLMHPSKDVHERVAALLWAAESDAHAVASLREFGEGGELARVGVSDCGKVGEATELANIPEKKSTRRSQGRAAPVVRTPEEIAALRAARAAKRAATGAAPHVDGKRR
jgi:tRNA-dihydrouridine synthase 3